MRTVKSAGIYDLPLAAYISDPCPQPSLNAGAAHTLLTQSPLHAKFGHPRLSPNYQSDESSRLDLGTIAHAILLEGDHSRVVVVEADDWRTKVAKEQRDEARAVGKLPILAKDHAAVLAMVTVAQEAIANSEVANDWLAAVPEQSLFVEYEGVWLRCRPDKMTKDYKVRFDYKSLAGSANPHAFIRAIVQHGYDLQEAISRLAVDVLFGVEESAMVFVCQEIEPPYAVSFVSLDNHWQAFAMEKLKMAMTIWKRCMRTNQWPAYPSRIAYVAPPAYAANPELPAGMELEAEDII